MVFAQGVVEETNYTLAADHYNQARTDFEMNEFESALLNFKKAYQLNSNNSDYSFGVAISFYELEAFDSAQKYIDIAIQLEPNQPDYHSRAGNIYFHSRQYQKAVDNYQIALDNLSDEYPINLHNCYYNKAVSEFYLKDYASAVQDLTFLVKDKPSDFSYIHLRGVSQLKMRKTKEACLDLRKAKELGNEKSQEYISKYCK